MQVTSEYVFCDDFASRLAKNTNDHTKSTDKRTVYKRVFLKWKVTGHAAADNINRVL